MPYMKRGILYFAFNGLALGAILNVALYGLTSSSEQSLPSLKFEIYEDANPVTVARDGAPAQKYQYGWEAYIGNRLVAGSMMSCDTYVRLGEKRVAKDILKYLELNMARAYGKNRTPVAIRDAAPDVDIVSQVLVGRCKGPQIS